MVLAEDLRQAVLQAALQGKLTEQLETDSNVDEMLKKIKEKKNQLIKNGDIKKSKSIKFVFDNEILFKIPDYWKWSTLDDITTILGDGLHGTPQFDSDGEYYFINGNNLLNKKIVLKDETKKVSKEEFDKYRKELNNDTMMISINGTLGNIAFYNNEKVVLGKSVCYFNVFENINKDYLFYFFLSFYFQKYVKENATGTTIKNVSLEVMRSSHIPIPPIEEQQRIVKKINEIMPKIDEYEKIEKELEILKKEFPTDIKDALLQAAMQGKLTEQLESDSSVDELLAAIKKEKEELIAQKKIKKEKPLSDIGEEEIPFDIPENWRWVRLGNIGILTRGNGIKRNEVTETGFPCIRYGELYTTYKTQFEIATSHTSKELFDKSQKVNKNDILMALTGENNFDIALALAYVGDETIAMGGDLTRWSNHHMNPLYLVYIMNSSYAIHKKSEMAKGDIIVHISNDKLSTILLPIPPIEEQNRIVEKLNALLPLCEDLKEK